MWDRPVHQRGLRQYSRVLSVRVLAGLLSPRELLLGYERIIVYSENKTIGNNQFLIRCRRMSSQSLQQRNLYQLVGLLSVQLSVRLYFKSSSPVLSWYILWKSYVYVRRKVVLIYKFLFHRRGWVQHKQRRVWPKLHQHAGIFLLLMSAWIQSRFRVICENSN